MAGQSASQADLFSRLTEQEVVGGMSARLYMNKPNRNRLLGAPESDFTTSGKMAP